MPLFAEKNQYKISIGKAINDVEAPVKEKHIRNIIIGTHYDKGPATFWNCVLRLPLLENHIIALKFCYVLHKVLQEGHPNVLPLSQQFRGKVDDLGVSWGDKQCGKLIQIYSSLLVTKMDFHQRNPFFPGNLKLVSEELESIGSSNINNYFQILAEIFDYLDEILNLTSATFKEIKVPSDISTTSVGEFRLDPLIPCVQESAELYDKCVKILFRLHASFSANSLCGLRERFLKQYKELQQLYGTIQSMTYFKGILHILPLLQGPPNFSAEHNASSYMTPLKPLPKEENKLQNQSTGGKQFDASVPHSNGNVLELHNSNVLLYPDLINERNNLIDNPQLEIARLHQDIQRKTAEHEWIVATMNERIRCLQELLAKQDGDVIMESRCKDILIQRTEMKAKIFEDKFNHMKEMYLKLSKEHQQCPSQTNFSELKFQNLKEQYLKLQEEHRQLLQEKAATEKQLLHTTKIICAQAQIMHAEASSSLKKTNLSRSRNQLAFSAHDHN